MKFKWRDHLDEVNTILDRWDKAARTNEGWSRPKDCLWIDGAIFALTGKDVYVESMTDICNALGIPNRRREDGMCEWGDAVKQ
jgi:hypothetical protein